MNSWSVIGWHVFNSVSSVNSLQTGHKLEFWAKLVIKYIFWSALECNESKRYDHKKLFEGLLCFHPNKWNNTPFSGCDKKLSAPSSTNLICSHEIESLGFLPVTIAHRSPFEVSKGSFIYYYAEYILAFSFELHVENCEGQSRHELFSLWTLIGPKIHFTLS